MKRTTGMTITYWRNGDRIREYHEDACRMGCKYYEDEQYDLLFNKEGQIIASYASGSIHGIEEHFDVSAKTT